MSVQDLAACNLDLCTAGRHTTNIWEESCHHIKKNALLAVSWAQFMPFSFVLYALYHYYITLNCYYTYYFKHWKRHLGAYSLQKTCPLAHPPQGISEHTNEENQNRDIRDSNIKLELAVPPVVSCRDQPIGIGLADVRQPTRWQFRLEIITQSIDSCGNGCALFLPDVIGD